MGSEGVAPCIRNLGTK